MSLTLRGVLEDYRLVRRLRATSVYQILHTVELFGSWLERAATIDDLRANTVNRWLEHLESVLAQRTVAGHRVNLLSLWRDAAERGLCPAPVRVRKVPKPRPNPSSWTDEELGRLLRVCSCFHGVLPNGANKRLYFVALINGAYDSGLRRSDLWSLKRTQIRSDGRISLVQVKTQRPHHPQFLPHTLDMVLSLPGECPLAWPGDPRRFYTVWAAVVAIADVRNGCLQAIRRTGATYVKRATGSRDAVRRYLGHASEAMQDFYVDESLAGQVGNAMPPPLNATWWQ